MQIVTSIILLMAFLMQGCAAVWPTTSGTLYYFEEKNGNRYYQLGGDRTIRDQKTGEPIDVPEGFILVTPDGTVNAPEIVFPRKVTKSADGDWDLHEYPVEKPDGYCIPLWSGTIHTRPESCLNRLWEFPSMIVGGIILVPLVILDEGWKERQRQIELQRLLH
jgi:hypothetical protein